MYDCRMECKRYNNQEKPQRITALAEDIKLLFTNQQTPTVLNAEKAFSKPCRCKSKTLLTKSSL